MQNTLGVQSRQDRIRVGLYETEARQIQSTVRDDDVHQTLVGIYGENEVGWNSWLRTVAGLRFDQFNAKVRSHVQAVNSGKANASKISPKISVIFGPWHKTEFFINAGKGFHSNDARGTTVKVDPKTGLPIDAVPGLVSSRGHELGIKSRILHDLQTTFAIWKLDFDSELVYVGDAGNTEVANLTFALRNLGPWSGSLGVRYIGAAPLIEDNSFRSTSSHTTNLRINRRMSNAFDIAVDVLNLTDRKNNDIGYYYRSRVSGEPLAGVDGLLVHPAQPRTVRVTARLRF